MQHVGKSYKKRKEKKWKKSVYSYGAFSSRNFNLFFVFVLFCFFPYLMSFVVSNNFKHSELVPIFLSSQITLPYETQQLFKATRDTAAIYLACGVDTSKV